MFNPSSTQEDNFLIVQTARNALYPTGILIDNLAIPLPPQEAPDSRSACAACLRSGQRTDAEEIFFD
jgi:hypothetical protein